MTEETKKLSPLEQAGSDLFDFAIDREDVRWLMDQLPESADITRAAVDHELQLLKIITVGWSIAYCLAGHPQKDPLSEVFWAGIREFAHGLRQTTELMTGKDIDVFQSLRDRLDTYVDALAKNPEIDNPAAVIGPTFAFVCGNAEDVFITMAGTKLFATALGRVRTYLEAVAL